VARLQSVHNGPAVVSGLGACTGRFHAQAADILTIVDLAVEAELRNIFEEIATGKTAAGSRQVAGRGFRHANDRME
jgi:hypothetical protein